MRKYPKNYLRSLMVKSFIKFVNEESASQANVTGGAIATKDTVLNIKKKKFMKMDVFEVDHDTYNCCAHGKKHGDYWNKYVKDESIRNILRKNYQKGKPMLIQSALTKNITYIRQ